MKFLSRLDDFEHIVIDGSVSGTGLSSLYLKDTATPILRIGNNNGDSFITYDGSELSISSDVDLRLTTPTDQDVFLITSTGNITTTQAGGIFTIGGGLTLPAITGGFLKTDANGVVSVDNSAYLTAETDTLDSVTDRGATTTNAITVGGITVGDSHFIGNETFYDNLVIISSSGENINLAAANGIYFNTNAVSASNVGDNRMYLSNAGNLGINSTAPVGRIDVRGNYGRWRVNGYGGMYFRNDSDTNYTRYIHPRSDGSLSFGRIADTNLSGTDPDSFAASSYDQFYLDSSGTAYFNGGINFAGVNGANFVVDTDGQRIVWEHQRNGTRKMTFYHEADADTFNFNFESGNKLQINGNRIVTVNELGTASSSAATDFVAVTGDEMTGRLTLNQNVTIGGATPSNGNLIITDGTNTLGIDSNEIHSTSAMYIGTNSGDLVLRPDGNTTVTNGKLGVGTTSPTAALHVQKAISGGFAGTIYNTQATGGFGLSVRGGNSSSQDALRVQNVGGTYLLNVKGDGNVGIGTTSPQSKLDVSHTIRTIGAATPSSGKGVEIRYLSGDVGSVLSYNRDSSSYTPLRLEGSVITLRESGSAVLTVDGGNVGIGTTSPAKKLDVRGGYFITSDGGTNEEAFVQGGNGYAYFGNYSTGKAAFGNSEDWTTLVADGGNVGIGTTSPTQKLEVAGNIKLSGYIVDSNSEIIDFAVNDLKVQGKHIDAEFGVWARSYGTVRQMGIDGGASYMGLYTSGTEKVRIDTSGNVGIGTTSPVNAGGNASWLTIDAASGNAYSGGVAYTIGGAVKAYHYVESNYLRHQSQSGVGHRFTVNAGTQAMIINTSGNVGIGTTSPSHTLDVNGELRVGTVVPQTSADFSVRRNGANIEFGHGNRTSGYYGTIGVQGNNGMPYIALSADCESSVNTFTTRGFKGNVITTDGAGSLMFSQLTTANATGQSLTERMRIDASGNVGIGTSSPSSRLHINKENALSVLTISRGGTDLAVSTDIGSIEFKADYQGSPISYGNIKMYSNSLSGVRSSLDFNVKSASGSIQTGLTVQGNSGTPRVGIGTASPSEKLHVVGDVRIEGDLTVNGSYTQIDTDVNTTEQWNVTNDGTGPAVTINQTGAQDIMDVQDDGTSVFYIEDGGNVGIGTTNPTTTLDVRGDIKAEGANTPTISVKDTTNDLVGRLRAANSYVYLTADHGDTVGSSRIVFQVDGDSSAYVTNGLFAAETSVQFTTYGSGTETGTAAYALAVDSSGNVIETSYIPSSSSTDFVAVAGDTMSGGLNIEVSTSNTQLKLKRTTSATGEFNIYTNTDSLFFHNVGQSTYPMMINSSGNVGIGTTNPPRKLSVETNDTATYSASVNASEISIARKNSSNTAGQVAAISLNATGWSGQTTGVVVLNAIARQGNFSNADFAIQNRVGGNFVETFRITTYGNVGIGTDTPDDNVNTGSYFKPDGGGRFLTVKDSSGSFIMLESSTTTDDDQIGGIYFNNTGGQADAHVHVAGIDAILHKHGTNDALSGGDLRFFTKPSGSGVNGPRMVILQNGNVGIGTTSPGATLEVNSAEPQILIKNPVSGTGNAVLKFEEGSGSTQNATITFNQGGQNNLTIATGYQSSNDENRIYLAPAGNIGLTVRGGTGSNNGNVGIGTTSPSVPLTVSSNSGGNAIRLLGRSSDGYAFTTFRNNADTATNGEIGISDAQNMLFYTGTSERMRIDSSGNVGIGTTSPDRNLHIYQGNSGRTGYPLTGGIDIESTSITGINILSPDNGYGRIYFGSPSSSTAGALEYIHSSTLSSGYMKFRAGGADHMFILGNGNISVGTTNAYARFSVKATSHNNGISVNRQADTTAALYIGNDGGNNPVLASNNADMLFGRDVSGTFTERMRLTNGGNLGINTTSPNYKLDVNGEAQLGYINFEYNSNYAGVRWKDSADNFHWKIGHDVPSGNWLYLYDYAMSSAAFTFKPNGDMLFTPGGNVGIGTTSPGAKLTIDGDGNTNNYQGVLRIGNTDTYKWSHISMPDTLSGNSESNNYYLIGRGASMSDRIMSFHIPNNGDYGDAVQPKFQFYSTGTDLLHSIEAETGKSFFKGDLGVRTDDPNSTVDINGTAMQQLRLRTPGGPSSTSDTSGREGDFAYDDLYLYIKTGSGWGRVALDFAF